MVLKASSLEDEANSRKSKASASTKKGTKKGEIPKHLMMLIPLLQKMMQAERTARRSRNSQQ
jgi:hypothetical protein